MPSAVLVYNNKSGSNLGAADDRRERLSGLLGDAGIEVKACDGDLGEQLGNSLDTDADMVVVAGGDGTIRAAIDAHRGKGRPIGILPGGTMNLLAYDYGVPEDLEEAAKVIAAGHTRPVDYGAIDGKVFLHTCFMGLPVRIGRHREDMRGKMNAWDRVRLALHAIRSLAKDPELTLTAEGGDAPAQLSSTSYAVLVGTMDDKLLPRPVRKTINGGTMTIFAIHPDSGADIARLALKGAFGFLSEDADVDKFLANTCDVAGPRRRLRAMLDGEDVLVHSPAHIAIVTGEVDVFAPEQEAAA